MLDALDAFDALDDSELVESMLTDDVVLLSSLRNIFCGDKCIDLGVCGLGVCGLCIGDCGDIGECIDLLSALVFSLDEAIVVGEFVGDGVRGVDTLLLASLIPKLRCEVRSEVFALALLRGELDTNVCS